PGHEVVRLEAGDEARESTLGQVRPLAETGHLQPAVGREEQLLEHLELARGQAVGSSQLAVEGAGEALVATHEVVPRRRELVIGGLGHAPMVRRVCIGCPCINCLCILCTCMHSAAMTSSTLTAPARDTPLLVDDSRGWSRRTWML